MDAWLKTAIAGASGTLALAPMPIIVLARKLLRLQRGISVLARTIVHFRVHMR